MKLQFYLQFIVRAVDGNLRGGGGQSFNGRGGSNLGVRGAVVQFRVRAESDEFYGWGRDDFVDNFIDNFRDYGGGGRRGGRRGGRGYDLCSWDVVVPVVYA